MATMMTYLVGIHPDECARLLASSTLGRLAVIVDGRPEIYPVNHVYDSELGCVIFPSNASTKLDAALNWPYVAFEVDGMDPDGEAGWSVLVVGHAEELTDRDAIARAASHRAVLWQAGPDVRWVRIVASKVSGRHITASDHGVTIRLLTPRSRAISSSTGASPRDGEPACHLPAGPVAPSGGHGTQG
jgi:uncharacterized protein